jgi:arsenate reductase (thioredoxin)
MGIEEFTSTEARLAAAADRLEAEFHGIHDRAEIEAMLQRSAEQFSGHEVESFVAILAERFTRERLRAVAQSKGLLAKESLEVVFVSLTGGGRAQIGAALLAKKTDDRVSVHTAGSNVEGDVDPVVREAMAEIGIDIAEEFSRPLAPEVLAAADIVVTMGRSVGEVEIPQSARRVDWRIGDPTGAELDEVRRVRQDIERRVDALAAELSEG